MGRFAVGVVSLMVLKIILCNHAYGDGADVAEDNVCDANMVMMLTSMTMLRWCFYYLVNDHAEDHVDDEVWMLIARWVMMTMMRVMMTMMQMMMTTKGFDEIAPDNDVADDAAADHHTKWMMMLVLIAVPPESVGLLVWGVYRW